VAAGEPALGVVAAFLGVVQLPALAQAASTL
jgi:flagellar motor component MotA